ncbi:glycoside hydrolase family protein [Roseinatronobacter sp.]|uniref:glycoside hydrolase family protein n=1 Tax=Roseinatronobacter sp. TaxID=1945755 RepID=UPI0025E508FD|nr:glycoside hydrolase family protein [Roseibaca sp.]
MQTSAQGVAFLERHEGVVLKAYRCPAGIWTIGAGLTAGSGVVKPRAGMVISRAEATGLLQKALRQNYEPAVKHAMPGAKSHEFDAGVSFHFNTGAIGRASWVRHWVDRDWTKTEVMLAAWNKGGGRVLPGLTRRRAEEFDLLRHRDYGTGPAPVRAGLATMVVDLDRAAMDAARAGFKALGYNVGDSDQGFTVGGVRAFQRDHDLTADGIVGRATLSTLQRMLDARAKAKQPAAAAALGGTESAVQAGAEIDPALAWVGPAVLIGAALFALWLAWRYRDAIAAKIAHRFPKLARYLWSI